MNHDADAAVDGGKADVSNSQTVVLSEPKRRACEFFEAVELFGSDVTPPGLKDPYPFRQTARQ